MEHPNVKDKRSGKVIFVSHCFLNQNAKVRGLSEYPGTFRPFIDLLLKYDVGIYQMPCPEMTYLGSMRWGQVRDQYDTPMFHQHCQKLADSVLDQLAEYQRGGYKVCGIVIVDGSPVCGLNMTPQPSGGTMWGGMTWYTPEQHFIDESGIFGITLKKELGQRKGMQDIPLMAVPEIEEAGPLPEALARIEALLS